MSLGLAPGLTSWKEDLVNLDQGPGTKAELVAWLESRRRHVADQFWAMSPETRRVSAVPSGWTARGLVRHLTLDVERVWFRAVVAGENADLPQGYEGWRAPESVSDENLLDDYASECARATSIIMDTDLMARPAWWFPDGGEPPHSSVLDVLLHVIVETATHAGHLDVCRELVDGGQRLVLDEPTP